MEENLITMIDLDNVRRVRGHDIAEFSRPLSSFIHEQHEFEYQNQPFEKSVLAGKKALVKCQRDGVTE